MYASNPLFMHDATFDAYNLYKNHSNYFRESYKTYTFAVSEFENEAFLMPRTDGQ